MNDDQMVPVKRSELISLAETLSMLHGHLPANGNALFLGGPNASGVILALHDWVSGKLGSGKPVS